MIGPNLVAPCCAPNMRAVHQAAVAAILRVDDVPNTEDHENDPSSLYPWLNPAAGAQFARMIYDIADANLRCQAVTPCRGVRPGSSRWSCSGLAQAGQRASPGSRASRSGARMPLECFNFLFSISINPWVFKIVLWVCAFPNIRRSIS